MNDRLKIFGLQNIAIRIDCEYRSVRSMFGYCADK